MDIYLSITDSTGKVLVGESTSPVYDPYSKTTVATPTEIFEFVGQTEVPITVSGSGAGAGKITFEPLVVTKRVDRISQTLFAAHAAGTAFKYADVLVVKPSGGGTPTTKPFLSYRLGTVFVSQIDFNADNGDDAASEKISFVFGQFQIGYQLQNADGTFAAFAPTGWDSVRNVKI